jgi:hypothetical protein
MHDADKPRPTIPSSLETGIIHSKNTYLIFHMTKRHNTTTLAFTYPRGPSLKEPAQAHCPSKVKAFLPDL